MREQFDGRIRETIQASLDTLLKVLRVIGYFPRRRSPTSVAAMLVMHARIQPYLAAECAWRRIRLDVGNLGER